MSGRPLATSIGLAIYFAERNRGAYHNLFMTFSQKPEFVSLRGETLLQKIKYVERTEWGMNTNLQAAFERVLETAMDHDVPPEEMPKALIVVSDMEIDRCGDRNWMFYDDMKEKSLLRLPIAEYYFLECRQPKRYFPCRQSEKRCPAIQRPVGYDIPESPEQY